MTIPIGASSDTLAGIAASINSANAGVTASVVTDASGARLALQSTRQRHGERLQGQVADDDGNNTDGSGLSRLAYDPQNGVGPDDAGAGGSQHPGDDQRHFRHVGEQHAVAA